MCVCVSVLERLAENVGRERGLFASQAHAYERVGTMSKYGRARSSARQPASHCFGAELDGKGKEHDGAEK